VSGDLYFGSYQSNIILTLQETQTSICFLKNDWSFKNIFYQKMYPSTRLTAFLLNSFWCGVYVLCCVSNDIFRSAIIEHIHVNEVFRIANNGFGKYMYSTEVHLSIFTDVWSVAVEESF
jgi:hypothetical protein